MRNLFAAILFLFLVQQTVVCQSTSSDYLKARSLLAMEQYDSSLHSLNKVIRYQGNDYDAIYYRGLTY